ncbi:MAG: BamA/TamA family outer membrane protein [Gemmatimonadota bacterium]|nr:MAG: BamA/TamA family outer membrane protein [Gemmatimonadota bacterium]
MPRAWSTAVILVAAHLAIPVTGVSQVSTARDTLPIVRQLRIEGNRAFSDDQIKRAIATRATGCRSILLSPFCWVGLDAFRRIERLEYRELRTDVARIQVFYFRRGYRQASVDTLLARSGRAVSVTLRIEEGAPVVVRTLELTGLDGLEDWEKVASDLPLEVGGAFSEIDLSATREQIERELRNRGYADAAVLVDAEIPSADTLGAYIVLRAEPGPQSRIGNIEVAGARNLAERDVRRLLSFRSGDTYSEEEIVRSQRSLYSLALFNYVDITSSPGASDSIIDIRVQVNEADVRGVQFGFGLSTTECLELQAGWAHRNFFGGTRKLEVSGALSNLGTQVLAQRFPCSQAGVRNAEDEVVRGPFNKVNWRVRADFSQPWFLGTQNWLNLGLFSERQSLPGIYARRSIGGDVRLSREIGPGTALVGTFRAGRDTLEEGSADFLFCANFGVCQPDDIATLSKPRWLSWIALTFARSRTDAVLNPTTGYRLSLEGEHASRFTGSEWAYYRGQGEASWYQNLGIRKVLALRVRAAFVRPIGSGIEGEDIQDLEEPVTHPLKRQYAGGAFTVRGFGQNLLGPKVLLLSGSQADLLSWLPDCFPQRITDKNTWICDPGGGDLTSGDVFPRPVGGENAVVANLEIRWPLSPQRWSGVAFVDVGRVWTASGELRGGDEFSWSPGLGIRYNSPVGPLRLDIGYNTGGRVNLPVVSLANVKAEGGSESVVVQLGDENDRPLEFEYDPFEQSGLQGFVNRLQLHFSIGQAF